MPNLLVTGFGPFGKFSENPSSVLASECGRDHRILRVSYAYADGFLHELRPTDFEVLLMIGVHGRSRTMRLETAGRNIVGEHPDVDGYTPDPVIDSNGPETVESSLWREIDMPAPFERTDDAGTYLCNYLTYQSYRRFPEKPVGFLHIPSFENLPREVQAAALERLLLKIEDRYL